MERKINLSLYSTVIRKSKINNVLKSFVQGLPVVSGDLMRYDLWTLLTEISLV